MAIPASFCHECAQVVPTESLDAHYAEHYHNHQSLKVAPEDLDKGESYE